MGNFNLQIKIDRRTRVFQKENKKLQESRLIRKNNYIARLERDILAGSKTCKKCNEEKVLIAFSKVNSGYSPTCKKCYSRVNKKDKLAKIKKYQKDNREKIKERKRNSPISPLQKIRGSMRSRLKSLFFRKGDTKTAEILGMPLKDFKSYLESKFRDNMDWSNYGKIWDIDHIIPCRAFDHSIREHVLLCWNYKNLCPEFKSINYLKNDRMSNGLSARLLSREDPQLLFKVRNEMLASIGLPKIEKDINTPMPINLQGI